MSEGFFKYLLEQYDTEIENYIEFTEKIRNLVIEILKENSMHVHSVTARSKDRESLIRKITLPEKKYQRLNDITDIAGVRIISYFEDEVDKIAECIDQEFEVDWANSVDKRTILDPDRFGYLSIHRVVRLLPERAQFIEYRRFPDLKCEVQIRSILQHAWAEIEHDLGYRTKLSVPKHVRRSFSRLAGLLEIADKEFISLKNELSEYEYSVAEQIIEKPQVLPIDKVSLKAFISTNETLIELDKTIADIAGACLLPITDEYIENKIYELNYVNVENISELETLLRKNKKNIISFVKAWIDQRIEFFRSGISLFYLYYVLLASAGDRYYIEKALMDNEIQTEEGYDELAQRVLDTFNSAVSSKI